MKKSVQLGLKQQFPISIPALSTAPPAEIKMGKFPGFNRLFF
jgi:hypothetical protein